MQHFSGIQQSWGIISTTHYPQPVKFRGKKICNWAIYSFIVSNTVCSIGPVPTQVCFVSLSLLPWLRGKRLTWLKGQTTINSAPHRIRSFAYPAFEPLSIVSDDKWVIYLMQRGVLKDTAPKFFPGLTQIRLTDWVWRGKKCDLSAWFSKMIPPGQTKMYSRNKTFKLTH